MPLSVTYLTHLLPAYRESVVKRLSERLGRAVTVYCGVAPQRAGLATLEAKQSGIERSMAPVREIGGGRLTVQHYRRALHATPAGGVLLVQENPRNVALPWLLRAARRRDVRVVLWGHFSSNNRPFDPQKHPADWYRRWLARQATACVAYTAPLAEVLRRHVSPEKVFVARNTLDTDTLFALDDALQAEGRAAVRARLGFPPDTIVMAYIGRLITEKKVNLLPEVLAAVQRQQAAHLVVIGDGPERAILAKEAAHLPNLRLLGALTSYEASASHLFAADVLISPGPVGLSVNHAFAFGLPIVTYHSTYGRQHGPEIAFLEDSSNARLVPQQADKLAEAILEVASEHDRYSAAARAYARRHLTLNKMVDGLEAAIRYAEASAY